jgi:energy-dependent translational throttle protein EttA
VSLIRLNAVGMQFDDKVVLREAFLKLREGDRVGLVGRNGTGKTTFLELILGRQEPTTGSVERNLGLTIGYFSQFSELEGHLSVVEELAALFPEVHATQAGLDAIGERLGEAMPDDEMTRLLSEQAELFERMDALDGWS